MNKTKVEVGYVPQNFEGAEELRESVIERKYLWKRYFVFIYFLVFLYLWHVVKLPLALKRGVCYESAK